MQADACIVIPPYYLLLTNEYRYCCFFSLYKYPLFNPPKRPLSAGIEADVTPSTFIVVNTSTPSYTEPYWSDLQLSVYSSCSKSVTWLAVITGAIVATTRYVTA